ncbi:MAG: hypothetical protein EBS53_18455 [Bacteroidetes bacterium]|nr:hypothetical protein [Bacteroidota bacterium]
MLAIKKESGHSDQTEETLVVEAKTFWPYPSTIRPPAMPESVETNKMARATGLAWESRVIRLLR